MLQGPKTGETAIKTGGIIPNLLPAKPRGKYLCETRLAEKYDLTFSSSLLFFSLTLSLFSSERFFYDEDIRGDMNKISRCNLVSKDDDRRGTRYIESSSG